MPNFVFRQSLGWVDAKGDQGRTLNYISADTYTAGATVVGNLVAAIGNLTNCLNFSAPGLAGFPTNSGLYGVAHAYESVTDKLVMTFIDAKGSIHRMDIPAPVDGLFLADGITVDPANADVVIYVDLITNTGAAAHFVSTRAGEGFTSFVGGLRTKKPNRRRISIFTKSANLDEPAE